MPNDDEEPKKERRFGFLRGRRRRAWRVFMVVMHIIGLLMSVDAVTSNRTAQGAIAWGVSLNAVPLVAVPLYAVFARQEFRGYVESFRAREDELDPLAKRVTAALEPYWLDEDEVLIARNYAALKAITERRLLGGNQVELLIDGKATFDSVIAGIERAEDYVLIQFYIVHDDGLGRRVKDAMIAAARRGVRVYFLFDEIGSIGLPEQYLADLREAGVEASKFNTTQGRRNRLQLNFRNHRKTVVVDGLETWVGGHNVGDEYLGLDPEIGPWRDTHVHIVGPSALHAQEVFVVDWNWATGNLLELSWTPQPAADADAMAMVLPLSPTDRVETAQLFFVHALNAARERIWIATPYFVPDPAITTALRMAALSGVDVRVIVPEKSDNPVADLAALWHIERLDRVGIKFYRYIEGFMHQKVFLIDDAVATVGSTNFDNRSFRLQFEVNALIYDVDFASQMEAMLLEDMERSLPMDPAEVREASLLKRLAISVSRLTSPLL